MSKEFKISEELANNLKALGVSVREGASEGSSSQYLVFNLIDLDSVWEGDIDWMASHVDGDEDQDSWEDFIGQDIKIRLSDHDLPGCYTQSDFDINTGKEERTQSHSSDWKDALILAQSRINKVFQAKKELQK